jgi:hypothetical protein
MVHRSLSPCVLDIFDFVKNSVRYYFSAWIFPPLEVVLVFQYLRRQCLEFVLSWRCPPLEVVLVVSLSSSLMLMSSSLPGEEGFGRGVAVSRCRLCGSRAPSWEWSPSWEWGSFLALGSRRSALGLPAPGSRL